MYIQEFEQRFQSVVESNRFCVVAYVVDFAIPHLI